jgi:hypothetical protein
LVAVAQEHLRVALAVQLEPHLHSLLCLLLVAVVVAQVPHQLERMVVRAVVVTALLLEEQALPVRVLLVELVEHSRPLVVVALLRLV